MQIEILQFQQFIFFLLVYVIKDAISYNKSQAIM